MSKKKSKKNAYANFDMNSFLPVSSFGKQAEKKNDPSIYFEATRKKKIKPEDIEKKAEKKKQEPVYQYGVDIITNEKGKAEFVDPELNGETKKRKRDVMENDFEEFDASLGIPYSNEVVLEGHTQFVSAIGLDKTGTRLLTGDYASVIRFWDFPAMDKTFNHFREIEPAEGYCIHTLQYNKKANKFLVGTSGRSIFVFDREGHEIVEFQPGYMYITNLNATDGHTSNINSTFWHPVIEDHIVSASDDSSIRLWDINKKTRNIGIIKVRNQKNLIKTRIKACAMSPDGKNTVIITGDGELQHFADFKERPVGRFNRAHDYNSETSDIKFASDGVTFYSRGGDETVKMWDLRNISEAVRTVEDLPNKYMQTNMEFSPDESLIATGTSVVRNGGIGKIVFLNAKTLEIVKELEVSDKSVISVLWHPVINQIFCGTTGNQVHVYYNPEQSTKGILYPVSKQPKKRKVEDMVIHQEIMNPNGLSMFSKGDSERKKRSKALRDPLLSHRPEPPQVGPGSGGRLGSSLTANLMSKIIQKNHLEADPIVGLMKYAKIAEEEPIWFDDNKVVHRKISSESEDSDD